MVATGLQTVSHTQSSQRPGVRLMSTTPTTTTTEASVRSRYAAASQQAEAALCCPVEYAPDLLQNIPAEILEKDYGCGDPSPYVKPGDTVLDLGSGGGKLCYIAAQIVGTQGKVIGIDCNPPMLALARKYQEEMAQRLGFANTEFRSGMIQDLGLDLELLANELEALDATGTDRILQQRDIEHQLRTERPLIESNSVDCIVSNCVLNLVRNEDRQQLFREMFRVLKRGGRVAISDIVSDEPVPAALQADAHLWSGCISGAWQEGEFLNEFARAGFHGMNIVKYQAEPWQTVAGIEFRSMTVVAYKGKEGPCLERNQAVIYQGPFHAVEDDDGHRFERGVRTAVCDNLYQLLQQSPYANQFLPIPPRIEIPLAQARLCNCNGRIRLPRETKGSGYDLTQLIASEACCGGTDCC
ncbi:MAG: methyltransferase domain-containing protein [Planctomycetaceae bacterium]|nr:methyltransferase domain-containing protein [Planctomycetaceae bacterium]